LEKEKKELVSKRTLKEELRKKVANPIKHLHDCIGERGVVERNLKTSRSRPPAIEKVVPTFEGEHLRSLKKEGEEAGKKK